jgi:HEAT repeat protein
VAAECQAVEVKRSLSPINAAERQALREIIAGLEPVGHTPIAAALRTAGGTLEGARGLSQVVLVTDGMETCHEDPAAVAEAVTLKHQMRRVEVVGLGVKEEEKSAVMRIARRGRGKFYDAQTAQQLAPAIKEVVGVALEAKDDKPADLPPRVKALAAELQDENQWVREGAVISLGKMGVKAEGAIIPALVKVQVEALQNKHSDVREAAAYILGKMGAKAKGAVPALVKRVADEQYYHYGEDKDAALAALKTLAPEKVEQALADATKAKNPEVKRWASDRLGELDEGKP